MSEKNIYTIGMHESVYINGGKLSVLRVPGGWIYTRFEPNQVAMSNGERSGSYMVSSVFVPYVGLEGAYY